MADPMTTQVLFQTAKNKLLRALEAGGVAYDASTQPYKSTLPLVGRVVESHPSGALVMSHVVFDKGQKLEYFGYGLTDDVPTGLRAVGAPQTRKANEADTNVAQARSTNGAETFIIEAVSMSFSGYRVEYAASQMPGSPDVITDPAVAAFYAGGGAQNVRGIDPASLATPPQVWSPFNLEDPISSALRPSLSFATEFDRKKIDHLGTADELFEGSSKSYLRASGDPRPDARFRLPEGRTWTKKGEPNSGFVLLMNLENTVVIPVTLLGGLLGTTQNPPPVPTTVIADVTVRLHGISVEPV